MFCGNGSFDQDIGDWNVSNVTDMEGMFMTFYLRRPVAFSKDIGKWNVSNVKNMSRMFEGADYFNQDIGRWNVSSVTDMSRMFYNTDFNQDIGDWDVSNVTDMEKMFYESYQFDQNISSWNVSNATNLSEMFNRAHLSMENYDLLLIAWSKLSLQENVNFHVDSTYCSGEAARQTIIDTYGWRIGDNGRYRDCQ